MGEAAPVLFCGKGQGLSPGHLFPRICPDSLCVICDKMDCRLFLQESEGFGDRLFLKQRMSLLSQMTSTPIDCLFQVRHRRSGRHRYAGSSPSFRASRVSKTPSGWSVLEGVVGVLRSYSAPPHPGPSALRVEPSTRLCSFIHSMKHDLFFTVSSVGPHPQPRRNWCLFWAPGAHLTDVCVSLLGWEAGTSGSSLLASDQPREAWRDALRGSHRKATRGEFPSSHCGSAVSKPY